MRHKAAARTIGVRFHAILVRLVVETVTISISPSAVCQIGESAMFRSEFIAATAITPAPSFSIVSAIGARFIVVAKYACPPKVRTDAPTV